MFGFGVSGTCWTLGSRVWGFLCVNGASWDLRSRVWGFSVSEWSLLGSGEQVFGVSVRFWAPRMLGFQCDHRMLGSGE